jgi:hypothetical protein
MSRIETFENPRLVKRVLATSSICCSEALVADPKENLSFLEKRVVFNVRYILYYSSKECAKSTMPFSIDILATGRLKFADLSHL